MGFSCGKIALWTAAAGLLLFVGPLVLYEGFLREGTVGAALAYLFWIGMGSAHVMVNIRSYPTRESASFFAARLCECLQYSLACGFWIAFVNPIVVDKPVAAGETGGDYFVETFLQFVWQRGLPFWLGLHFSWLDREPFKGISFTADGWRKAPTKNVAVVVALAMAAGAQAWLVSESGRDVTLLATLVFGTLVQELLRMLTAKASSVHVHHYYVGAVMGALCWYSHPYSVFVAHLMWGVYVEGVAAWGRDPTFLEST